MKILAGLLAASLASAGLAAPAIADGKPAGMGRVTVVSSSKTSLTLTWSAVNGASRYIIERGANLRMHNRTQVRSTTSRTVTIGNLTPGKSYCFQVRAKNGHGLGDRSRKACQFTISRQGGSYGARYRVVTYNTCAVACKGWSNRRPRAAGLVRAQAPDVVALQETPPDSGMARAIGGMTQVVAMKGKALLFRSSRFNVAMANGHRRVGHIDLGKDPRFNKHRYAVWAELVDRAHNNKHVIFLSLHLAPGGDTRKANALRNKNTNRLIDGLRRINPRNARPMVIAGDFNTHQGRSHNGPSKLLRKAGYASSFFNAEHWERANLNSGNQGRRNPIVGNPWGYHLDQVWLRPGRTQVELWRNAARLVNGYYPSPMASNHSPVLVKVLLN